jgi:hypothetical protein
MTGRVQASKSKGGMTMKVKYANRVESHVAPAIGKELVKAGIATMVSEGEVRDQMGLVTIPAPKPGSPRPKVTAEWEVGPVSLNTRTVLAIKMTVLKNVTIFTGEPDRMPSRIGGWQIPPDVAENYRREYVNNRGLQDHFAKYAPPEPDPGNIHAGDEKRRCDEEMKERAIALAELND